jgi:membrane-associated phospholipid phosphatase
VTELTRSPPVTVGAPATPDGSGLILEASPGSVAERVGMSLEDRRPIVAALAVLVAGYVLLAAVVIGVGVMVVQLLVPATAGGWDDSLNRWLADHRVALLDHVTAAGTFVADTVPVVAITVVVSVVFLVLKRWREPTLLVSALALEFTVFLTANWLIDRARPDVVRLDSTPSTASYPSGHIAATIVVWGGVALIVTACTRRRVLRGVAWVVAIGLALLVGFARVYRGMHHFTDVVAGAALGVAALLVALLVVRVAGVVVQHRRGSRAEVRR